MEVAVAEVDLAPATATDWSPSWVTVEVAQPFDTVRVTLQAEAEHEVRVDDVRRFFQVWSTNQSTFTVIQLRSIESILRHHPNACVCVYAEELPVWWFSEMWYYGHNVRVGRPSPEMISQRIPVTAPWAARIKEWRKGRNWYSHYSDWLRMSLLYLYGGTYTDTDYVFLRELGSDGEPFTNTTCTNTGKEITGTPPWSAADPAVISKHTGYNPQVPSFALNGAFLSFDKGNKFPVYVLQHISKIYTPGCWGCHGPHAVTHIYKTRRAEIAKGSDPDLSSVIWEVSSRSRSAPQWPLLSNEGGPHALLAAARAYVDIAVPHVLPFAQQDNIVTDGSFDVLSPADSPWTACSGRRFFQVWSTHPSTFTVIQLRSIESILRHHPNACVCVYSEELPVWWFSELWYYGHNVRVGRPSPEMISQRIPVAAPWAARIREWRKGRNWYAHYADWLRLALLYLYGGTYTDTDYVFLRELGSDGEPSTNTTCTNAGGAITGTPPWSVVDPAVISRHTGYNAKDPGFALNNAFLSFDKGNKFLVYALEHISKIYRPRCWDCHGPRTVTHIYKTRLAEILARSDPDLTSIKKVLCSVEYNGKKFRVTVPLQTVDAAIETICESTSADATSTVIETFDPKLDYGMQYLVVTIFTSEK
eukprot:m51a1_g5552 hypothetical protein (645) ;mRNA; r:542314-547139